MKPLETTKLFDDYLAARNKRFEATCIGGTPLALLGVTSRETRDCDVLVPQIPADIKRLSEEFAQERAAKGDALRVDWLNNGPASLVRDLPGGWEERRVIAFEGRAMRLLTLGRMDFLRSKLFALCDRAIDRGDCIALRPTREELLEVLPWLDNQDGNPDWPEHVRNTVGELARALGYEL